MKNIKCFLILFLIIILTSCSKTKDTTSADPEPEATIEELEIQLCNLINQDREANGIENILMDENVRLVARNHCKDMITRDYFEHITPDGKTPGDRLNDAGINVSYWGENIAYNGALDPPTTAEEAFMNSEGHRANILNNNFTHSGVGCAIKEINGANRYYFTQLFVEFPPTKSQELVADY